MAMARSGTSLPRMPLSFSGYVWLVGEGNASVGKVEPYVVVEVVAVFEAAGVPFVGSSRIVGAAVPLRTVPNRRRSRQLECRSSNRRRSREAVGHVPGALGLEGESIPLYPAESR